MSKPEDLMYEIPVTHFVILGQYYYALGHHAGGMHITREATGALYGRYKDYIRPEDWDEDGIVVLSWFEQIGRLAAQIATNAGAVEIDAAILDQAAERVEEHVKATKCRPATEVTGPIQEGKYCRNGN